MDYVKEVAALISALTVIMGFIWRLMRSVKRITEGQKAMLRKDLTDIYYAGKENRTIKQYQFENAMLEYEAYKALGGNSFIDKVFAEIGKWEVVE